MPPGFFVSKYQEIHIVGGGTFDAPAQTLRFLWFMKYC